MRLPVVLTQEVSALITLIPQVPPLNAQLSSGNLSDPNQNAYALEGNARANFGNLGVSVYQTFQNATDLPGNLSQTRDLQVTASGTWADSFVVQSSTLANGATVRAKVHYQIDVQDLQSFRTLGPSNWAYSYLIFGSSFAGTGGASFYCLASGSVYGQDPCSAVSSQYHPLIFGLNMIEYETDILVGQTYTAQSSLAAFAGGLNEAAGFGTGQGVSSGRSSVDAFHSAHSYFEIIGSDAILSFASGNDFSLPASTDNPIPEPESIALTLVALGALAFTRQRRLHGNIKKPA